MVASLLPLQLLPLSKQNPGIIWLTVDSLFRYWNCHTIIQVLSAGCHFIASSDIVIATPKSGTLAGCHLFACSGIVITTPQSSLLNAIFN